MKNIFKNAYFGKPYKTRDGRKALFVSRNLYKENTVYLLLDGNKSADLLNSDGYFWADHEESKDDIVSEWQEERQVILWNNLTEDEKSELMLDIVSTRKPIDEMEKAIEAYNADKD